MRGQPHRVVVWSVTGVVALLMAMTALWLVVYAIQQNHNAIVSARAADCDTSRIEHATLLSLVPTRYQPQVAEAFRQAERKICL